VDEVFRAPADPSRRRLLDSLNGRNGLALRRIWPRTQDNPLRRAHSDPGPERPAGPPAPTRIPPDVPPLEVDTADGYRPGLDQIVAFVNRRA
jgi:hypothetical protein